MNDFHINAEKITYLFKASGMGTVFVENVISVHHMCQKH